MAGNMPTGGNLGKGGTGTVERRGFGPAMVTAVALMLLVAGAVGDRGWLFPMTLLATAAAAVRVLHRLFPGENTAGESTAGGTQFALGAANALAIYACLYAVIGRAAFPAAADWARAGGFALPVLVFVLACVRRRHAIRLPLPEGAARDLAHLPRFAGWAGLVAGIALLAALSPAEQLPASAQTLVLLAAMAGLAAVGAAAVADVVRLLSDIADILRALGQRLLPLVAPVVAFTSLWALLIILFGCVYRIADALSPGALFGGPDGPLRLSFADAMHFSVVTLSSVGYGDIRPVEDGIRVLASVQMLAAQLLLLFGFYEIMRGSGAGSNGGDSGDPAAAPPAEGQAAATKPGDDADPSKEPGR